MGVEEKRAGCVDSHASVWMFLLVCAWRFRPVQTSTATRQEKQEWDSSPVEVIAQPLADVSLSWRRSGPVPCSVTLHLEHWPTTAHSDSILKKCSHLHNVGTLRLIGFFFGRGCYVEVQTVVDCGWLAAVSSAADTRGQLWTCRGGGLCQRNLTEEVS